jgi:two-component system phosphate regulon response regulator PhoB
VSPARKVLIVEDHKPLRSLLSFLLGNAGYDAVETPDARTAIDEARRQQPDLVLLDWQLPDMDGVRLLRHWRSDELTAHIPVIMMSGQARESDRVTGLRAGADDYLVKPFGKDELLARVQAVLRRTGSQREGDGDIRQCGEIAIDVRSLRVMAGGRPVHLGPIEFKMLNLFVSQPDRVLSRAQIIDRVWRVNAHVDDRTVDVHIRRLRRALADGGQDGCIQTVRGVGYRLARVTAAAAPRVDDATDDRRTAAGRP